MTDFRKIVRNAKRTDRKAEPSYTWKDHLKSFEKGMTTFVPAEAFNGHLLSSENRILKEGVVFEAVVNDYASCLAPSLKAIWFAKVIKVCGYRVLAHFIGAPNQRFWINALSDDVFSLAYAGKHSEGNKFIYCPPRLLSVRFQDNMDELTSGALEEVSQCEAFSEAYDEAKEGLNKSRFRVGQRLELLNYNNSREMRVARVQATCGRRINVLVMKRDYPGDLESDRQVHGGGAQYWIDESSFFIFPVGFAVLNGLSLKAKKDYEQHSKKIAESIRNGETPKYDSDDVTFETLMKKPVDPELWGEVKVGMKFELIDPLAQAFNSLHVASILEFCKTDGYIIVGMDGPDALEDSFPVHIKNPFMFKCGYAKKNGLELVPPEGYGKEFKWNEYLEKTGSEKLPLHMFNPMPSEETLNKFQVGMRLEAADMCENQLICPATIKSVHGRIINVNFDGWDAEYDELYDVESHDIFPIGWCELHDYPLQFPQEADN